MMRFNHQTGVQAFENNQLLNVGQKSLIAGAALLVTGLSLAFFSQQSVADEEDPLKFIAGVSRLHDDNLFRQRSAKKSENITSAYAGIRLDKLYAQQRFKFDFTLTANRYQNYGILDFNAKDYKAAWLWSLTPFLKGTISLDRKQSLNSFQDFRGGSLVNIRNINTSETQHFEADFSPHNVWHILGGVTRSTQKNSNNSNSFEGQESFTMNSLDAGARYNFSSGSSVTVMGHGRSGDYDGRQLNAAALFDTAFDEREVETKLDWILSGKSRVNARVAYLSRDHDHFSQRDFSGLVGNVDYSWTPTGKLRLILSASSSLSSYQTLDNSYTRLNSLSISPLYAFSDKITMRATAAITKRTFLGEGVIPDGDRVDWSKTASFGVDWSPLRAISIGGSLERSSRDSNIDVYDYNDTTIGVNANLAI